MPDPTRWLQVLVVGLLVSAQCEPCRTPGTKATVCLLQTSKYKNLAHRLTGCNNQWLHSLRPRLQLHGGMEDDSLDTQGMTDHASEGAEGESLDHDILHVISVLYGFPFVACVSVCVCVCLHVDGCARTLAAMRVFDFLCVYIHRCEHECVYINTSILQNMNACT